MHTPFSDVFWLERYWINQPSKLQPYHKWHGAHVLAYIEPGERYTRAYFTSGNIISAIIAVEALSKGWPNSEASARPGRRGALRG